MNRRTFWKGIGAAVIGWLGVGYEEIAEADPLLPYIKASNAQRWTFLRESEIKWLNEATQLANTVARDVRDVTIEHMIGTGPIIRALHMKGDQSSDLAAYEDEMQAQFLADRDEFRSENAQEG
jgi:hypothetical protein